MWELPLPDQRNGQIRHFEIKLVENETQTISSVNVYDTMKEIVGLHPYYRYLVQIAAHTVDSGPLSSPITITTLEAGKGNFIR